MEVLVENSLIYRSAEYVGRDRGSYRFTDEQRASGRLIVEVEVVSSTLFEYKNRKYPEPQAFYGYGQLYYGDTVVAEHRLGYGRQRVIDTLNLPLIGAAQINRWFTVLRGALGGVWDENEDPPNPLITVPAHPHTVYKVQLAGLGTFRVLTDWWELEDLISERAPAVDPFDPADERGEYPDPRDADPNDPYAGDPQPDPNNPDSDPRDFRDGPRPGDPVNGTFRITMDVIANPGNCIPVSFELVREIAGTWVPGFTADLGPPAPDCGGGYHYGFYLVDATGRRTAQLDAGVGFSSVVVTGWELV